MSREGGLAAASLCRQPDQLAGVQAIEVELAVQDPGSGFQVREAFFDRHVVRRPQRMACGQGDVVGVQEERGNGKAHDGVLSGALGPGHFAHGPWAFCGGATFHRIVSLGRPLSPVKVLSFR